MTTNSFPDPRLLHAENDSEQRLEKMSGLIEIARSKTRLKLFFLLCKEGGTLPVAELTRRMNLSQPTISHHLGKFREANLIDLIKHKHHHYYLIRKQGLREILEVLRELDTTLEAASDDPIGVLALFPGDPDALSRKSENQ